MRKMRLIAILLFFLAIWLPAIQMEFPFYREFTDAENRELAGPPKWKSASVQMIIRACDAYVDDHFGFRPDLIRWNNLLRIHLFGVSPASSVVVGKDSWLFYCSESLGDGNSINDYLGNIPLSRSRLEDLRLRLEENNRIFREKGIKYIVAIAPNKNTIYGEYMPERIRQGAGRSRLDQFVEYMEEHSDFSVLDLRGPLLEQKRRLPVFWATDSHWNTFGAYVGYKEIMKRISDFYPDVHAIPITDVSVQRRPNGGDLAQILFIQDVWPEKNNTVYQIDQSYRPVRFRKLVFRHDSFGDNLYPFLTRHFEKIVHVAPFAPFRFEEIFRESPEIVLHVFAERYLTQAIHDDFFYRGEQKAGTY